MADPPPPPKWWSLQADEAGQSMEEEERYLPYFPVVMRDSLAVLLCVTLPLRLHPIHKLQPGPRRPNGQEARVESWCQQVVHSILQFTYAKQKPHLEPRIYTPTAVPFHQAFIHRCWTLSTAGSSMYAPLWSAGEDSTQHASQGMVAWGLLFLTLM